MLVLTLHISYSTNLPESEFKYNVRPVNVTGNCRWKLSGHIAPVTCLRLDPCGGCFLSLDSECRDRSIRLWNLVTGDYS